MNTLLIGPRASGKTSLGRRLASRRDRRFVDLDDVVLDGFEETSVRAVWAEHGEEAWRAGEVEALRRVLAEPDQVVALGGGTPVIPEARTLMEAARRSGAARVLYLRCSAVELRRRLARTPGDRPRLTETAVPDEVAEVLARREPIYEQVADAIIDANGNDLDGLVERLEAALSRID
ncbi:MAG: shikimate kinase [Planctomycetes bacterium]|nr:shikimate kinase [Planctomycetota bacterium]